MGCKVKVLNPDGRIFWLGRGQLKINRENATYYDSPSAARRAIAGYLKRHDEHMFIPLVVSLEKQL